MWERLDPATRPSRLPPLIQTLVLLLLSLSFVSGLAVWRGQYVQARTLETPPWLHGFLILHGWLNPFLCALFGYLCCLHIRIGWQLKANFLTGFSLELILAGQILSGAGLYYAGSPEWRNALVWAHRIFGGLLPLGLGAHWLAGLRWAKKFQNNPCT